jgi:hypothetical protein
MGFWRSTCALMRVADEHGGADWGTRSTIHTIGVSFTAEMAFKAAYEETIGRVTAWLRGSEKTPQDKAVARMATDYSAFLLADIARRGGAVREIAGNDDIMVTLIVPANVESRVRHGRVILRTRREGFSSHRLIVDVKVADLAALLKAYPLADPGLEHVFDY